MIRNIILFSESGIPFLMLPGHPSLMNKQIVFNIANNTHSQ